MAFTDLTDALRGWGRSTTYDGIRLASPNNDEGSIMIHQRVPLRPIVEMIAEHARVVWRAGGVPDLGPTLLFHTAEGEHACLLPVRATGPNGEEGHVVAVVLGDDHAVLIDGVAALSYWAAMKDRVGRLAENYFLALGDLRRRKFEYSPPPGWNGQRRATSTWWYHPEYPRQMAIIKAQDARPAAVTAPDILDRMLFVDPSIALDEAPAAPVPCQNRHGLIGNIISGNGMMNGLPVTFAAAVLADERYTYYVRLEAHRELFREVADVASKVVDSIVPIPRNTLRARPNLIHWIE